MRFTHSIRMDWLLPGIPPTGKRVELPVRRHRAVRRRQGRARAHVLGPGFGARPGRPARPHAPRSRRRNRGASAQPDSTDERAHPSRVEQERDSPAKGPPRGPGESITVIGAGFCSSASLGAGGPSSSANALSATLPASGSSCSVLCFMVVEKKQGRDRRLNRASSFRAAPPPQRAVHEMTTNRSNFDP